MVGISSEESQTLRLLSALDVGIQPRSETQGFPRVQGLQRRGAATLFRQSSRGSAVRFRVRAVILSLAYRYLRCFEPLSDFTLTYAG
jgi:hypothetical protein